jgi:oxygen-independent coproporphyrinogen III oxidase
MNLASLALAEKSAPRYTSYPTAPYFTEEVDARTTRRWLSELRTDAPLSLYLHVPYCPQICAYCGCHTKALQQDAPLTAYKDTLVREIELLAMSTPARRVVHIHWGGGTPSMLGPVRLVEIVQALKSNFELGPDVEHAIELDPRIVEEPLVEALAKCRITRASLGVQDLNAEVQKAAGREQPFEVVARAVALLRGAGIDAINFDLMYGLPLQGVDEVIATARLAAGLSPSRLAVFGYAHVPWFKSHQKLIDSSALAGASERLAQAVAARETLESEGYVAIGLDHFARPDDPMAIAARNGVLRRNFQGYTVDPAEALLPLGVSSIGRLPQGYIANAVDVAGWRRAIESGEFATRRGREFTREDAARAEAIERLMCDFAVNFGAVARAHGFEEDMLDAATEHLAPLVEQGLASLDGRRVELTSDGRPFARLAAAAFDAYLHSNAARHSVAV